MNFLEQLAAEWYQYRGSFVRTNVRWRKREKGGFDGELDVLAYDMETRELIHIETSGDSDSWDERRHRFLTKKFVLRPDEYRAMVKADIRSVRRIAVVGQTRSTKADLDWGPDLTVMLIPDFIREVVTGLPPDVMRKAVPEGFPLLRAIQMVVHYCGDLLAIKSAAGEARRREGDA